MVAARSARDRAPAAIAAGGGARFAAECVESNNTAKLSGVSCVKVQ